MPLHLVLWIVAVGGWLFAAVVVLRHGQTRFFTLGAFARLVGNWAASLAYCSTHLDARVALLASVAVFALDVLTLFAVQRRVTPPRFQVSAT